MLTDHEKAMINLAGEDFKYAGSLDTAAMERFGMTPTRFWQEMNRILRTESAVAYRPAVVARLRLKLPARRRQVPSRLLAR
ncbi:DUF3263 domain-containing protein [Arthrobacter sp. D5-1]|uniref:DUF3263 domain-containing protein n=1 Tax=Arthrobacter sp. D5-1 TaxID=1477518 RepID=UPI001A99DBBC|nr:DUF3263 domain-containing protein [Arthrobacter sp. D5-1]QSZ49430.1 hypothetical protein AYX22_14160 [Arthrobacter sp. D5-1]